jgi:hypothetical protein
VFVFVADTPAALIAAEFTRVESARAPAGSA